MRAPRFLAAFLAALLAFTPAFARADDVAPEARQDVVYIPASVLAPYRSGAAEAPGALPQQAAPAQAAQAQAGIDGRQYAVIAPVFTGSDGNLSFLRLMNRQGAVQDTTAKTTTFSIMVVGTPSGQIYGTAHIGVPALASPQYAVSDILTAAGAGALSASDTGYSFYLQDADAVAYQHVIYNGANGFFENVGVCDAGGYINGSGNSNLFLPNVHTSVLATYPSQVFIHNYAATAASYQVNVIDARTGTSIGIVQIDATANTSYTFPETFFEQSLKWTPNANQQHANLLVNTVTGAPVNAVIGQYIYNQQLSAYINMSMACDPDAVSPAAPATAQRVFKGVLAQTQPQSPGQAPCTQCQDRSGTFTIYFPAVSSGTAMVTGAAISNNSNSQDPTVVGDLGPPIALSGTYSADTGQLTMSAAAAASGATTYTGTVTNGVLTGTYSSGQSETAGAFAGVEATLSTVTAYCGSFQNNGQGKAFMLAADGNGTATGVTTLANGVILSGQMSGAAASGTSAQGGTFSGTVQNNQMTGTYADSGVSAAFTAGNCALAIPAAPSNGGLESVPLYILVNQLGVSGTVKTSNGATLTFTNTDHPFIGTTDVLTATAASGSTFRGWGGACSGTGACSVVMNTDQSVTATFCDNGNTACVGGGYKAPETLTVNVVSGGATGYTVTSSQNWIDCVGCTTASVALDDGTRVQLNTNVPLPATFVGWSGACTGNGGCNITMNGDTQVTATFKQGTANPGGNSVCSSATGAAGTYALHVNVNQAGTGAYGITSVPSGFTASGNCGAPSASFAAGTTVTLTATGTANQVFQSWSGACAGTGTCTVTLNADTTVTANYFPAGGVSGSGGTSCSTATPFTGSHTLTFTPSLGGSGGFSVTSSPSGLTASGNCTTASAAFAPGTSVTLTATGAANQVLKSWSGACAGIGTVTSNGTSTTGACTITMDADTSVGASYGSP